MRRLTPSKIAKLKNVGFDIKTEEDFSKQMYVDMKIRLGMLDLSVDSYPDPYTGKTSHDQFTGMENVDTLMNITTTVLKYLGNGLFSLSKSVFKAIRFQTNKVFRSYPSMVTEWKSSVWKNSREIDGTVFDSHKLNIVPHAELIKRIQAVETIHKALSNIGSIYNSKVSAHSDEWSTPECDKVIKALEKIGYGGKHLDIYNTSSKQYAQARKSQPLYLHGYTPKRVLELLTRCEKLAQYGDSKYVDRFESTYLKYSDDLEKYEMDTTLKSATTDSDKADAIEEERNHIAKIKAARLWWLAHFLKASYTITTDILKDVENLAKATEKCVVKESHF